MTLAAVSALSMAMCASAMAANIEDANVTTSAIEDGKATVTYTGKAAAGEEVTVLLLKPDANTADGIQEKEIAYIDQKTAGTDGAFEFKMPITEVEEGNKFKLMSASASSDEVTKEDANFGGNEEAIHYGDVNGDTDIDTTDALEIIKYFIGDIEFTDNQLKCADVDNSGDADTTDALEIIKFFVGDDVSFDYSWTE